MKSTNTAHARERNSEESLIGQAHHALRAYVKAFSSKADGAKHSFQFAADRKSASVLNSAGQPVLSLSIEQLAAEGSKVRFALAGLRDVKEKLEAAFAAAGTRKRVRYNLDVTTGVAEFSIDGEPATVEDLLSGIGNSYRTLMPQDPVREAISSLTSEDLGTAAGWAKIGNPVSTLLFGELESAEEYGFHDAATRERERAYRLGLIRRPVDKSAAKA